VPSTPPDPEVIAFSQQAKWPASWMAIRRRRAVAARQGLQPANARRPPKPHPINVDRHQGTVLAAKSINQGEIPQQCPQHASGCQLATAMPSAERGTEPSPGSPACPLANDQLPGISDWGASSGKVQPPGRMIALRRTRVLVAGSPWRALDLPFASYLPRSLPPRLPRWATGAITHSAFRAQMAALTSRSRETK